MELRSILFNQMSYLELRNVNKRYSEQDARYV